MVGLIGVYLVIRLLGDELDLEREGPRDLLRPSPILPPDLPLAASEISTNTANTSVT